MAAKKLIYAEDARRAILRVEPKLVYCIDRVKAVDAVPVDMVAKMFYDFTGDLCPCNYTPWDEWLSERCELQDECPNPEDEMGCWKQFIKHCAERKDNDNT